MVITLGMVAFLAALINSSLNTMRGTTRSLEQHDGTVHVLRLLREDLAALVPLPSGAFRLQTRPDTVELALARSDPRPDSVRQQGYLRHVIYLWDRTEETVTRSVYHSLPDREAINATRVDPNNTTHPRNLARLLALTPGYAKGTPFAWITSEPLQQAREEARTLPVLLGVAQFTVRCFLSPTEPPADQWADPGAVPVWLRVDLDLHPHKKGGQPRRFDLIVPLASGVQISP